jgi:copper oxidase (laccase) domain-containing protein
MAVNVAISTVADGSMYNRHDSADAAIYQNRITLLQGRGINPSAAVRLAVSYDRDDFCQYTVLADDQLGRGVIDTHAYPGDALITTAPGTALFLPIADCVGAVFFDPENKVLALAHLGRHSLEQLGGAKIVHFLVDTFGSDLRSLQVWLTPAAGKDVYKIWALENKGMKEATLEQLFAAGVLKENINDSSAETTSDLDYFSYSEFLKGNRTEDGDHAIVAVMQP